VLTVRASEEGCNGYDGRGRSERDRLKRGKAWLGQVGCPPFGEICIVVKGDWVCSVATDVILVETSERQDKIAREERARLKRNRPTGTHVKIYLPVKMRPT
jgi:hypothetical protein